MPTFSPSTARLRQSRAFTLVEVVLSMGIFGFAVLAIFGMIAASNTSMQQSSFESRATLIARQIFDDLRQPLSDVSAQRIITGGGATMPVAANSGAFGPCLYYFDAQTQLIGQLKSPVVLADAYNDPAADRDAAYLALVTGTQVGAATDLSQVLVTVESPASSPAAKRNRQRFVCLVKLNQ